MNEQLLHFIPLFLMIINSLTTQWVIWSGTLILDNMINIDLNMYWGLYNIDIQSSVIGKSYISMSIPDFIEFTNNYLNVQIIQKSTLPLYYSIYFMYIICIFYEFYNVSLGIRHITHRIDKNFIRTYYIFELCLVRTIVSAFLLWSLFTYYNTDTLCINNYIPPFNNTRPVKNIISNNNNEICTYSWTTITILLNEFLLLLYAIYVYSIKCHRRRTRSNSDNGLDVGLQRSNSSLEIINMARSDNNYVQLRQN